MTLVLLVGPAHLDDFKVCVTGMRTADKHFPALVFRNMQKHPTTQPTPLTSSLEISPHLAASLGF
jgi:hypothetical protein